MFVRMEMSSCHGWQVVLYYFPALCGSIGIIHILNRIVRFKVSSLFTYMGSKTLYALISHFLAFKLVSFIYISYSGLPISKMRQFQVLSDVPSWMWVVYTVVGVALPLLVWEMNDKIIMKVKGKFKKLSGLKA